MSVVLYVLGGLAVMLGAALAGFGVPIKEFGTGNTLILSGTVVFCTGLLLVALAATVAHLARLTDLQAMHPPARETRPLEPFDRFAGAGSSAPVAGDGRIPFPPRPRPPAGPPVAEAGSTVLAATGVTDFVPSLHNPDIAPPVDQGRLNVPLISTAPPGNNLPPPPPLPSAVAKPVAERPPSPLPASAPPPAHPQASPFDAVWPVETRPDKKANGRGEQHPAPRFDASPERGPPATVSPAVEPTPSPRADKQAAAVLKSGVVDGMAYTLYVDGSIEAELPQGTLRFASINDLREHLETNGA